VSAPVATAASIPGLAHEMPSRNAALDGLKYVAAASIVLHHTAAMAGGRVGGFLTSAAVWGLFFFVLVSGYLHGALGTRGAAWLRKRFVRLAIPYAVWSLVYVVALQRASLDWVPPYWSKAIILILFSGASGLLWTLPMLFYCAVGAELLVHNSGVRRAFIGIGFVLMFVLYWTVPLSTVYASPLYHFIFAPRWFAVYLLGMEIRALGTSARPAPWVLVAALGSLLAAGAVGFAANAAWANPIVVSVATPLWLAPGVILLWAVASGVGVPGAERFAWGRDDLLGIYVSHLLWLLLFAWLVPPASLPVFVWIPAAWASVLAAATATTALIKAVPFLRPVVV
jgi:fucose 4-O-acetylase-like acetyltransferase